MKRPFVLLKPDLLQGLRAESKRESLVPAKQNAELWLKREIVVPARSGHFHNFTCVDGTRLMVPAGQKFDKPTSGPMVFTCPACGKTYTGEKFEAAMRQQEHVWLIQACRDLALVGCIEQRAELLAKAAEILVKYADAYPGRHTKVTEGGIFYQSLDESVHFITLAQAYDVIYDSDVLTAPQKQHIENDLFWEAAEGFIKMGIGGNWGSWHLSAVGVIGLATKHQRYLDYGLKSFKSQMTDQLGDDGLWPESVHTYHFYPMCGFLHLAEGCANVGIDLYNWEAKPGKGLKAMFVEPLYYMYPNFQLPAINDGWYWSFLPLDIYQIGWKRYHLPELGWAVRELKRRGEKARTKSPDTVAVWSLLHAENVPDNISAPKLNSKNFPVLGISVLRKAPPRDLPDEARMQATLAMTFDYGRFRGHGQNDLMGVTFFGNGQVLTPDYGTPNYGAAIMPYYKGTSSHNTIMFDGRNTPSTKLEKLLTFADEGPIALSCAETTAAAANTNWRRLVLLTDAYGLVFDQIRSAAPHDIRWLIHADGELDNSPGLARPRSRIAVTTETVNVPFMENTEQVEPGFPFVAYQARQDGTSTGLHLNVVASEPCTNFIGTLPAETATRRVAASVTAVRSANLNMVGLMYAMGPESDTVGQAPRPKITMQTSSTVEISVGENRDSISFTNSDIVFDRKNSGRSVFAKYFPISAPVVPAPGAASK